MKLFAFTCLVALGACSSHDKPKVGADDNSDRPRRVLPPPSGGVRALPPHAIRADGVGPYKLGASVSELLDQLPSGPRITQFTIPGVVRRDLLRAEEDAILIGAEPQGRATFVAVVRGDIAKTEAGIHVGSTRDELVKALGVPLADPDHARDPRIIVPTAMKNTRFVMDDDKISAIVVETSQERDKPLEVDAPPDSPCTRPPDDHDKGMFGICLTAAGELVHAQDDELLLVSRDGEKQIVPRMPLPGLVFAAALRNPVDNRDDLVAITRTDDGPSRTWSLTAFRLAEGKLVRTIDQAIYPLTSANARWIGADLANLDLYMELTSRSDAIEVGGLLTTRISAPGARLAPAIRDIVVISPLPVPRRRPKLPAHEAVDAGAAETPSEQAP